MANPKLLLKHTPDTDVFIIALSNIARIAGSLYVKTGTRDKERTIDLSIIRDSLKNKIPKGAEYDIKQSITRFTWSS